MLEFLNPQILHLLLGRVEGLTGLKAGRPSLCPLISGERRDASQRTGIQAPMIIYAEIRL